MEGLGVEESTDEGGGRNIGYTDGGDYADFIIYSEVDSDYKVDFRFAAAYDAGEIGLYLVDENGFLVRVISPTTAPNDPEIISWIKSK